ncbi:MAG: VWA domain-containing protein [Methylococcaceae bacterium]|nr:VWA domain-containing protein [Methylococcaceae bacterium]
MKTKLLATFLFVLTAAAVLAFPRQEPPPMLIPPPPIVQQQKPVIDVVFVLDTTGSMGGLIQAAKEKIWSIASSMAQAQPAPQIRMGLVAYRDRGDDYVTRVIDLSSSLDTVYATLMDFRADGGGDGPESVNQALADAVHKISWSQDPNAYKVIFLVGDAPPHMDYQDDVKYPASIADAKAKGIVVNTIQCGNLTETTAEWQRMAQLGQGSYFAVAQSGSAVAVASPYDRELAELSAKLDATRLYYGSAADKAKAEEKEAAGSKLRASASVESQARRATFNRSKSGAANLLGEKELVEDVSSGKVDVGRIAQPELPAALQAVPPGERKAEVEKLAKQRDELKRQIDDLAAKRADYVRKEVDKAGGAKDSLDAKIYGAVREQAGKKGLSYEAAAPAY